MLTEKTGVNMWPNTQTEPRTKGLSQSSLHILLQSCSSLRDRIFYRRKSARLMQPTCGKIKLQQTWHLINIINVDNSLPAAAVFHTEDQILEEYLLGRV